MLYVILHCKNKNNEAFLELYLRVLRYFSFYVFTPQFPLTTHPLQAPRTSVGTAIPPPPLSASLASYGIAFPIYATTSRPTPSKVLLNLFWETLVCINTICLGVAIPSS